MTDPPATYSLQNGHQTKDGCHFQRSKVQRLNSVMWAMLALFYWIYVIVLHLTLAHNDVAVELEWPTSSVRSATGLPYAMDGNVSTCFRTGYGAGQDLQLSLKKPAVISSVSLYLPRGYTYISVMTYNYKNEELCGTVENTIEYDRWVTVTCSGKNASNYICIRNKNGLSSILMICEVGVYATKIPIRDPNTYRTSYNKNNGRLWTTVTSRSITPRFQTTAPESSTKSYETTKDSYNAVNPSSTSTVVSKTAIIASAIVVTVLIVTCTIVVIFIVQKKKSDPVVVVLNRGESGPGSVAYSEPEYTAINYDAIGSSNVTVIASPPVPGPRSPPAFTKGRDVRNKAKPPPYYHPLEQSTPPGSNESMERIKISSLYCPSP